MPEKITAGEASYIISADPTKFLEGLDESKKALKKHSTFVQTAVGTMAGFLGAELVNGVKNYVTKSITEYARLDRSISNIVSNARRFGNVNANLRGEVERYLDVMEATTRFQDTAVAGSFNTLLTVTKDLNAAMYLNRLAMDMATAKDMELAQAASLLEMAFRGDERATAMLARELGIVREKGMTTAQMLSEIEKRFGGAATKSNDLLTSIEKMTKEFGNFGEKLGDVATPTIVRFANKITSTSQLIRGAMGDDLAKAQGMVGDLTSKVEDYRTQVELLEYFGASKSFSGRGYLEAAERDLKIWKEKLAVLDKSVEAEKKGKKAVDDKLAADERRKALLEKTAKAKEISDKREKDNAEQYEKDIEAEEEAYRRFGETVAGDVTDNFTTFFDAVYKGQLTTAAGFEMLWKSMVRSVMNAIAGMLEQWSAYYFAMAVGEAIGEDYAQAAYDALAGASFAAAAGAMRAGAANLATGGFALGGTRTKDTIPVNIRQNEAVVPLDDPSAMRKARRLMGGGDGGNVYHVNVTVPNADRATMRTAARRFIEEKESAERRQGLSNRRN